MPESWGYRGDIEKEGLLMEFGFSKEQNQFRREISEFIRQEKALGKERRLTTQEFSEKMYEKMGHKGWLGLYVPKEFGGQDCSLIDTAILFEELSYQGAPEVVRTWMEVNFGLVIPIILNHASVELKKRFLPSVCSGELKFSMCSTEPNAGSDIAGVETRAIEDGDHFIVNGTKIYNESHRCNYTCAFVRTDPKAPKEEGLGVLIIDLKSPGIAINPIWMHWGLRRDEVVFEDVKVPRANLVGEKNRGWDAINSAIAPEWSTIANPGLFRRDFDRFIHMLRGMRFEGKPMNEIVTVRHKLADLAMEIETSRLLYYQAWWKRNEGLPALVEAAMAKVYTMDLWERLYNELIDILGQYGQLEWSKATERWPILRLALSTQYKFAPALAVGGWPSEMQRNVIAQVGMGLPYVGKLVDGFPVLPYDSFKEIEGG